MARAANALLTRYRDCNPRGFTDTDLKQVRFFHTGRAMAREPPHYPPGLAIILSGAKIGYLDGQRFEYGAGSYLAVGLPLVFECETRASPDVPLFGLFIALCPAVLAEPTISVSKARAGHGAGRRPRGNVVPAHGSPFAASAWRRHIAA